MLKELRNGVLIGLGILFITLVPLQLIFSWYQERNEPATPASELTQQEHNDMYLKAATDGRKDAIASLGDPAFSAYVFGVLDKRCPFYENGGANYRDCLWSVVNEKEAVYKKNNPSSKEIEDRCQSIASNLGGLLSGEIILSCRAYKLSQ